MDSLEKVCLEMQRKIHAYIDDELESKEREHVESHIRQCSHCLGEVSFYSKLQEQMKIEHSSSVAPMHLQAKISSSIRFEDEQTKQGSWWTYVAVAAAFVFFFGNFAKETFLGPEKVQSGKRMQPFAGLAPSQLGSFAMTSVGKQNNRFNAAKKVAAKRVVLGASRHALTAKKAAVQAEKVCLNKRKGPRPNVFCTDPIPHGVQAASSSSLSVIPTSHGD